MKTTCIVTAIAAVLAQYTGTVQAKSVYVVVDTNYSRLRAYQINGSSLTYQDEYQSQQHYSGAVGVALAGDYMFLTFEGSAEIEVVSAKTLLPVEVVTAPGASNLAGIVADYARGKVYAVDRGRHSIYVYDWNPRVRALTLDEVVNPPTLQNHGTWVFWGHHTYFCGRG